MTEPVYRPRGDFVLIRIVELGQTVSGIAMPQTAVQGKEFQVVAIGPQVDDLMEGDKVLMIGKLNTDYFALPNSKELIVIKQEYVVLVVEHDGTDTELEEEVIEEDAA